MWRVTYSSVALSLYSVRVVAQNVFLSRRERDGDDIRSASFFHSVNARQGSTLSIALLSLFSCWFIPAFRGLSVDNDAVAD